MGTMGDIAENVFLEVAPLGRSQRLGWRRPKISMKHMPHDLRHMPDFYADSGHMVEVVGLGRDGVLKVKLSKYEALKKWTKIGPVVLFIWNSHLHQWTILGWDAIKRVVDKARRKGIEAFENDGNEYYPIEWEWIVDAASYVSAYHEAA